MGSKLGRAAAAVLAAGALALASAPAATAAPTITYLGCESGGSKYHCFVDHTAGVGAVSYRWEVRLLGQVVHTSTNQYLINRSCSKNRGYQVQVWVTDSTGTSTDSTGFSCNGGPWP